MAIEHSLDLDVRAGHRGPHRSHLPDQHGRGALEAAPGRPHGPRRPAAVHGHRHQHAVTTGDGRRLVEQVPVGAGRRRVGVEHTVLLEVGSDGTTVVGQARFHPLEAVDGRTLAGQRRQYPGPGGHAGVLLDGSEQGEAVTADLEHRRHGPGPLILQDSDARAVGSRWGGTEMEPVEDRVRARSGARRRPAGRLSTGCRGDRGHGARGRPPGGDDAVPGDPGPRPSHEHGKPLLAGAPGDRPEREDHRAADPGHGHEHAGQRRPAAEGQHGQHQAGGDRRDLARPPSGDDAAALQGWEAVADPRTRTLGVVAHRSDRSGR